MWAHHLRICVTFSKGLSSRRQGGCRCRSCIFAQVFMYTEQIELKNGKYNFLYVSNKYTHCGLTVTEFKPKCGI